jgi:hypothetical protein
MLSAVEFNHNPEPMAGEVGEVWTDRRLTAEVMLLERRLPQVLPELFLGFGRIATQGARAWHAAV